jgi:molecular chaperone DnaK (HSP70)
VARVVARFAVGIDLGTTNTVVAYAPTGEGSPPTGMPSVFPVPQLVSPREVASRPLFPSLLYAPTPSEGLEDLFGDAPWALGEIGVRRGPETPGRVVASSKSWLVHAGVDRTAAILPWGAPDGVPKVSPVGAAARLLAHVRHVWDADHPDAPLAEQDVALTVPASFDEVARELTVKAAHRAGLDPTLLEEPQAAFYDWMATAGPDGLARLVEGAGGEAFVLVVDVGGGTTDLSLVRVGERDVAREAVGPHLLVGGDNMDLALAHLVEPRIAGDGEQLDPAPFAQLTGACRAAKEALLGAAPVAEAPVAVAVGRGAQLVGSTRTARIARDEAERVVLEGFFPRVAFDDRPQRSRGALLAFGLPYERDVAITRHVAAFVARHLPSRWPDAVLLNGGVFRSARIVERLSAVLADWKGKEVIRLPDADPDLAVARGAVAHLRARRGRGLRIGGGSGRGYFIGIAADSPSPRAVCVVPRGAEEGVRHSTPGRAFALAVGTPVRFDLYASDEASASAGQVVDVDVDRFVRLPPIATVVRAGEEGTPAGTELRVAVEGEVTPIGTLDLACVEMDARPPRRFRLAFQLREVVDEPSRSTPPARRSSQAPPRRLDAAVELIDLAFGKARAEAGTRAAKDLLRSLERVLGERSQWSAETNRALFDVLMPHFGARRRSTDHERVFWLLVGWCVRPGFGDPRDPDRIAAMVALFDDKLAFPTNPRAWQHFFIAWRRAAGGLDEAVQTRIRDYVDPFLGVSAAARKPKKVPLSLEDALDMASSLERVEAARRAALGASVLERTWTDRDPRLWAALGRLGARVPAYASVHYVVPPRTAEQWLDHLLREKWDQVPTAVQAVVQLARRTGDRARDVSDRVRGEVEKRLVAAGAAPDVVRVVREVVAMGDADRASIFGDALPIGLRLME